MAIITGLVIGVISGVVASFLIIYAYEQETKPFLEIVREDEPAHSKREPACFYHLIVRQKKPASFSFSWASRRPAWSCKATYEIYDSDRKSKIMEQVQCRWPNAPEPLIPWPDKNGNISFIPDFSRLYLGRKTDIFYNEDQALDLVLKREGEEECYIFTNECYLEGGFGYRGNQYKLEKGSYQILARIYYEAGSANAWFRLDNLGTKKDSVRIAKA